MVVNLSDTIKSSIDNAGIINSAIAQAKDGDTIILPPGLVPLHTPIQIINKVVNLKGDETTLAAALNTSALIIKGISIKPVRISGITFQNYYGLADSNSDGVYISAIVLMENCWVKSFGGNGITVQASLGTTNTNASFSTFRDILLSNNKGNGIYFQGGDANQCSCFHVDSRDNGGWGFDDESFLGCQFFGCMAHSNKSGHYKAGGANSRSTFFGCYGEGGSPKNWLNGNSMYIGGMAANGFDLFANASVQSGKYLSSAKLGTTLEINQDGMTFFQEKTGSYQVSLKRVTGEPLPHFGYSDKFGIQHEFFSASKDWNANYCGRKVTFSSDGFKTFFIGSRLYAEGKPGDTRFDGFVFKFGDTLLNPDYDGSGVREWIFKKIGWEAIS